jgi:hypothetical protein
VDFNFETQIGCFQESMTAWAKKQADAGLATMLQQEQGRGRRRWKLAFEIHGAVHVKILKFSPLARFHLLGAEDNRVISAQIKRPIIVFYKRE